jgi:hypothetical protein
MLFKIGEYVKTGIWGVSPMANEQMFSLLDVTAYAGKHRCKKETGTKT